jgi:formamidopyrimidine-DNA glycosylase
MPEGVEVKLSTEIVKPLAIGKRIINAFVGKNSRYKSDPPEGFEDFIKEIETKVIRVTEVKNKGKFMYWSFDNDWHLLCTFGMSGQWSPKEGKHLCFGIYLGDDPSSYETIYFNDPRHFGTIKIVKSYAQLNLKLSLLGWDPLQEPLDKYIDWLSSTLSRNGKPIGEVMMDQEIFAGVGNYIRAEALYLSKISPFRTTKTLSKDEIKILCQAIINVMEESYKHQGATIQTYKTVYGEEGKYSSCFKVYGQKKDPLGNTIIKQDSGGRTIHWCPTVQV